MKKVPLLVLFTLLLFNPHPAAAEDVQGELTPLVYENERCGIKVTAPPGWIMYEGMRRYPEILTVFSRLPYELNDADNPHIILRREKAARRGPDSAIAKAFREAEVLKLMKNLPDVGAVELLDGPRSAEEITPELSVLSFEITRRMENKKMVTSRAREYIFLKDGMFYVLLCGVRPEFFDKYRAEFDAVAKSLTAATQ